MRQVVGGNTTWDKRCIGPSIPRHGGCHDGQGHATVHTTAGQLRDHTLKLHDGAWPPVQQEQRLHVTALALWTRGSPLGMDKVQAQTGNTSRELRQVRVQSSFHRPPVVLFAPMGDDSCKCRGVHTTVPRIFSVPATHQPNSSRTPHPHTQTQGHGCALPAHLPHTDSSTTPTRLRRTRLTRGPLASEQLASAPASRPTLQLQRGFGRVQGWSRRAQLHLLRAAALRSSRCVVGAENP